MHYNCYITDDAASFWLRCRDATIDIRYRPSRTGGFEFDTGMGGCSKQFAANLHGTFVYRHVYLRCLVYESMHSSYRISATMTKRDYKKSENDRHLSRTALLWLDQWRHLPGTLLWHGNSRQASGGDQLWAHVENYAPISATHLWFPRNGLYSLDRFRFIIRTPLPKPPKHVWLLVRHYLLLSWHCILPLVSRYKRWRMMMRHLWYRDTYRDTWVAIRYAYRRPKYRDTSKHRCIVTSLLHMLLFVFNAPPSMCSFLQCLH